MPKAHIDPGGPHQTVPYLGELCTLIPACCDPADPACPGCQKCHAEAVGAWMYRRDGAAASQRFPFCTEHAPDVGQDVHDLYRRDWHATQN
jgi:hypothetical protein